MRECFVLVGHNRAESEQRSLTVASLKQTRSIWCRVGMLPSSTAEQEAPHPVRITIHESRSAAQIRSSRDERRITIQGLAMQ